MATPQSAFRTVTQQFTTGTTVQQFLRLTRQRVFAVIREFPFIAIVIITIVLFVLNAKDAGRFFNTPVLPVTYLIVGQLSGMFLFFLVIATLYAGELVWKERGLNFDQIYDALPMPGWVTFASQLTALAIVQLLLAILMITFGVITQAVNGYFKFELHIYLKDILGIWLIGMLQYTVLALLIQNLVSNKFLGHTIIILYNLATIVALRYGFENYLYQYSTAPNYTYSDMNGFGHYVKPLVWFSLYWTAGAGILAALAILFTRRGADLSWKSRWQIARERFRFPINVLAIVCLLAFAGIGVFIYHNTHRLNSYRDGEYRRVMQARYERQYKKYEALPQPKITAVEIKADLFPEQRSFQASGSYVLLNQSDEPIQDVHLLDANESFRQLKFDRAAKETLADKEIGYHIYQLAEPLKPKESLKLEFTVGHESKGFRNNGERNEFAFNGTFFDSSYFPVIGYNRQGELSDEDERRDQGLAPQPEMPLPDDPKARRQSLFSQDSRWINFKATVSTAPDQIAVAPGYLQREWIENGRRYFAYDMGETKIQNFYSFVSGKYQVRRDQWQGSNGEAVNIEVYYHPGHEYNIARMIDSTKKGLDYFTKNFGPYQFKQFRILEFPRYRSFAQSFPNTIPYSEGIGFIAHAYDENDLDAPFYVTAHELAHQWWGHQVIGCFAQGSNMLSESLAQYSALMLMEKEVGASNIRTYLKNELDRYLRGRSAERRKEPPMYLVQSEPYVWYQKGSLVMYALKDYLGEEKLNAALKKFLEATKYQEPPYTNSLEFIKFLKDAAPDELKPVIADLFEHITLFDNRAIEATYRETPDKKYIVKIKVEAKKLHADGLGAENEVPINDLVDIGVFVGEKKNQRALFLEKRRLTRAQSEFEITVSELPTRAGIDPYNKLIDRKPDDNTVVVSKSE